MKTTVTSVKTFQVTLELTVTEAKVIQALVQNPLCPPADEPVEMRNLRKDLWDMAASILSEN